MKALRLTSMFVLFVAIAGATIVLGNELKWRTTDSPSSCVRPPVTSPWLGDRDAARCLRESFEASAQSRGVVPAIVLLARAGKKDPAVLQHCHLALHLSGQRMASRRATMTALATEFPSGTTDWMQPCASGFVHGVMQGLARTASNATGFIQVADATCRQPLPVSRSSCVHAVGHGIARQVDNRLSEAVASCHRLAADIAPSCVAGASMEAEFASSTYADALRDDTALGADRGVPCKRLAPADDGVCRAALLETRGTSLAGLAAFGTPLCTNAVTGAAQQTCARSLGSHLANFREPGQLATLRRACGEMGDAQDACWFGAGFGPTYVSGTKLAPAAKWCESATRTAAHADVCLLGAARGVASHRTVDNRSGICNDLPRRLATGCAQQVESVDQSLGTM